MVLLYLGGKPSFNDLWDLLSPYVASIDVRCVAGPSEGGAEWQSVLLSIAASSDSLEVVGSRITQDRDRVATAHAFRTTDPVALIGEALPATRLPGLVESIRAGSIMLEGKTVRLDKGQGEEQIVVVQDDLVPPAESARLTAPRWTGTFQLRTARLFPPLSKIS